MVFDSVTLTRTVSVTMVDLCRDLDDVLRTQLKSLEGICGKDGYIKCGSTTLLSSTCPDLKGNVASTSVQFTCQVANPDVDAILTAVVEHNTRAGITARFDSDTDPFTIFLVRDHHLTIPHFVDFVKGDRIKVKVIGKRFEVNDEKISIIATIVEEERVPDVLEFYSKSVDVAPGKGRGELASPGTYPGLVNVIHWRKQLCTFDVAEFTCSGEGHLPVPFPRESRWKTQEHFIQAARLSLKDPEFAKLLRSGDEYGKGDGQGVSKYVQGILSGPQKHPVKLSTEEEATWASIRDAVQMAGARAKFSQHPDKLLILRATRDAVLMHSYRGKPSVRFTHYEHVRRELG